MRIARFSRLHDLARQRMPDDLLQAMRSLEHPIEIDARVVAHALQHVHDVLGADIAGRARREGAAAQPTEATFETHDASRETGENVCQTHAARVVKMQRQREVRKALCYSANKLL